MSAADLTPRIADRQGAMLESLRALIGHESPTVSAELGNRLAELLVTRLAALGGQVARHPLPPYGDVVVADWPEAADPDAKPALLLLHYDTVWPEGTLAERGVSIEGNTFFGPGSLDMKASIVIVEEALRAISVSGQRPRRPIRVMITSDEEVGSPESRRLIEAFARESAHVLVMEPPLPGGELKIARKGVGRFLIRVHGRAAHAGVEPEKGVNAIVELARHLPAIADLGNAELGTTVNPGLISGGTSRNTVAPLAECDLDARAWTLAEAERIERELRAITPVHPEATIEIIGSFHRPPMEFTPASEALFSRAAGIAAELGQSLGQGKVGGASDANLTSALGIPTLDGLGALGKGAHTPHEQIEIDSLVPRATLLAGLLLEL
jgi:glutamate carboxypeptidase